MSAGVTEVGERGLPPGKMGEPPNQAVSWCRLGSEEGGDAGRRAGPVRAEGVYTHTAVSVWTSVGLLPVVRKAVLVHEVIFVQCKNQGLE